jgi:hypothetical protein
MSHNILPKVELHNGKYSAVVMQHVQMKHDLEKTEGNNTVNTAGPRIVVL